MDFNFGPAGQYPKLGEWTIVNGSPVMFRIEEKIEYHPVGSPGGYQSSIPLPTGLAQFKMFSVDHDMRILTWKPKAE